MDLYDYYSGDYIRKATAAEVAASEQSAEYDGCSGVILVTEDGEILEQHERGADDARRCYVG